MGYNFIEIYIPYIIIKERSKMQETFYSYTVEEEQLADSSGRVDRYLYIFLINAKNSYIFILMIRNPYYSLNNHVVMFEGQ